MKAQVKTCSYSAAERSQDRSRCMPLRMSTCTALASTTMTRQALLCSLLLPHASLQASVLTRPIPDTDKCGHDGALLRYPA